MHSHSDKSTLQMHPYNMLNAEENYERGRAVCAVDFRRIEYGRPACIAPSSIYVEWYPDWPEDQDFDSDKWEDSACSFWAADRQSVKLAYGILRCFAKHPSVKIASWPDGLAIGQIGTGKQLVIGPA